MDPAGNTPDLRGARAVAMVCVVVGHALLSFMDTPIGWAIQDRSRSLVVDLVVWSAHAFVMPAFFCLSGHAACAAVERAGVASFVRERLVRVGVPLALLLVPNSLALNALWDWGRRVQGRGVVAAQLPALRASGLPVTLGHLWFLYYVLVLSAAAAVVVLLARRWAGRRVPAGAAPWFPVLAVVPVAALLWTAGKLRLDTPLSFLVDPTIAAFYLVFFAWGWLLRARPQELRVLARHAWILVVLSLALVASVVPALRQGVDGASLRLPLPAIAASAALSMTATAAFLGWCVRHSPSPLLRRLSSASYWCYLVHLPIVVFLQIALASRDVPGPVKVVAIVGVTFALCLLSQPLVRRVRYFR